MDDRPFMTPVDHSFNTSIDSLNSKSHGRSRSNTRRGVGGNTSGKKSFFRGSTFPVKRIDEKDTSFEAELMEHASEDLNTEVDPKSQRDLFAGKKKKVIQTKLSKNLLA